MTIFNFILGTFLLILLAYADNKNPNALVRIAFYMVLILLIVNIFFCQFSI